MGKTTHIMRIKYVSKYLEYIVKYLEYIVKYLEYIVKYSEYIVKYSEYIAKYLEYIVKYSEYIVKYSEYIVKYLYFVQRSKLLDNTESIERMGSSVDNTFQICVETEAIGGQILSDLHSQREQINRSRSRVCTLRLSI